MNNQQNICVIVPVFMVSEYLDRCLESLVRQKYSNIRILLVDDGSLDESAVLCDKWANEDDRILVIHKTNGGLSDARNNGFRFADGGFISFIDSDDFISEDFYEIMLTTALQHDSDIVECDVAKVYESGKHEDYHDDLAVSDYSATEGLSGLIDETAFHQHVWNKLYRREVVENIIFEVGKLNEDEFWTYQVFGNSKIITKINQTMYFYFQRESSIMGQGYNLRRLDALEGKRNRQLYIEKNYPELALQARLDFFGSCIFALQSVIRYMSGTEKRKAVAVIKRYKKMCHLTFNDISAVNGAMKKYYYLAKINIYLCSKLRVIREIE